MIKRNLTILVIFIIGAFILFFNRDYELKQEEQARIALQNAFFTQIYADFF